METMYARIEREFTDYKHVNGNMRTCRECGGTEYRGVANLSNTEFWYGQHERDCKVEARAKAAKAR